MLIIVVLSRLRFPNSMDGNLVIPLSEFIDMTLLQGPAEPQPPGYSRQSSQTRSRFGLYVSFHGGYRFGVLEACPGALLVQQPACEKVCWVGSPALKNANEDGRRLRAALGSLASWCRELPYNGSGGSGGRGACPIEDWIGRRCKDRGTSVIAYLILLGTEWDRRWAHR